VKTALPIRPAIVLGIIAGLTLSVGLPVSTSAQEAERTIATGSHIPLAPNAPDEYVVKKGDTLWDISKAFLRDPWYWPEIWYVNPQVANPHLIYPGDVLKLVYVDGKPRVTLADDGTRSVEGGSGTHLSPRVRKEPLSQAITAIPYDVIASFMGRPTLLDKSQVSKAPYVVAMRDDHIIGALGNEIYARGIKDAAVDSRYSIIHIQEKIYDPDNNDLLGYSGMYVGSGPVAASGDPAKLVLTDSSREALQGDKLFPEAVEVNVDFVPHAPAQDVNARVIAVSDHTVMGQYQVVALNRGTKHGLEPGHVLALFQAGHTVRDSFSKGGLASSNNPRSAFGGKVQLPDERAGIVMVFKSFDRMSYALIMESSREIVWGDYAKNP
jgi:LysM repeat protein